MNFSFYTNKQLYPDMPEDILNNIRTFVRNQSASSLMQMMQTNHAIDIALQEAEPILNMIDLNNPIIHHSQDSNQTVSNTTHHSDQNTMQNQMSHTQQMNALYHADSSTWCLPVMYSKDDKLINKYCSLEISNITGSTANYLDEGSWAISVEKPTQIEIRCTVHTPVKTLNPPLTFITLQPACSAFSPEIKLPPYFK